MAAPADQQAQAPPAAAPAAAPAQSSGGDALDKGISTLAEKAGYKQSNATIEKISDGARGLFKKFTGKDVPIADKDYK